MDDEVADVVVDEGPEVAGDDLVRVAVADGDAVEVLQGARGPGAGEAPRDAEAILGRDGRGGERVDVVEDDDGRGGLELLQEVDEDGRGAVRAARLVEEDADAAEPADGRAAHAGGEAEDGAVGVLFRVLGPLGQELAGGHSVFAFGVPLVLFPVAPEDEDTGQKDGEAEREPSAVRDLCESRREIETVEGAEN